MRKKISRLKKGFTLIELLVVISILVILSGIALMSFSGAQARGRDAKRRQDLRTLQKAVEMYYSDNGYYPSTGGAWWGQCSSYGNRTATCGISAFIPGICPTYIGNIPRDPRADTSGGDCYLYRSDGNNYSILAHVVMETVGGEPGSGDPMDRVCCYQPSIAAYSPGARDW